MTPLNRLLSRDWSALALAVLFGAAALSIASPAFLGEYNLYVFFRAFCVLLLVAFAQMVTLLVGQINLSVGALGGLVAIVFGGLMEVWGVPVPIAIAVALVLGTAGGLLNGMLTVRTGINGFIITLATASAFAGINLGVTESIPFYQMPTSLVDFGAARIGPVPYLLFPPLIVAVLLIFFLTRTVKGRWLMAVGGNATRRSFREFPRHGC